MTEAAAVFVAPFIVLFITVGILEFAVRWLATGSRLSSDGGSDD